MGKAIRIFKRFFSYTSADAVARKSSCLIPLLLLSINMNQQSQYYLYFCNNTSQSNVDKKNSFAKVPFDCFS